MKVAGRWRELSTRSTNYNAARKVRQKALQAQEAGSLPTDMAKWPIEKAAMLWKEGREKEAEAGSILPRTYISESYLLKSRQAISKPSLSH